MYRSTRRTKRLLTNLRKPKAAPVAAPQDDTLDCQGVCKDCHSGSLNNGLNPAFGFTEEDTVYCLNCGSTHLDLL
jgi:hypothetical protein